MVFCTKCGTQVIDELSKYCHKCGAPLVLEEGEIENHLNNAPVDLEVDITHDTPIIEPQQKGARAYELGVKLEQAVEKILKAEGYSTERRKRLTGEIGSSEIDIVASKVRKDYKYEIVVECKNYSSPIPVKEVQAFESKMRALGKKNGLFAVIPNFSREAAQWGQNVGLKLWSWDNILEKLAEIEVGRLGIREIGRIKYFLPLKVDYDTVVKLHLENAENVEIEKVKLIWKPFHVLSYKLKCTRIDPRKQKQVIEDSGTYIIDGLLGDFVQKSDSVKNAFKKILGQSSEESQRITENSIVLQELMQSPETNLNLKEVEAYDIVIHKPIEKEEKIRKRIIDAIIEDNTQCTYYRLKRDEDNLFADQREFRIVPLAKEVHIFSFKCVYIPKWEIEYKSKEYTYTKTITGNSGATIYDTITYCNKHFNIGIARKKNLAVCDVCGNALCSQHICKCSVCGSWRCETHSKTCTSCQGKFCPEHMTIKCAECNGDVCDSCATICVICGEPHCRKHMTKCSKCERIICTSCSIKEGGILKIGQKVYCKDCRS